MELIVKLLEDKSTVVAGSAVQAFEEVCPERLDLIHKSVILRQIGLKPLEICRFVGVFFTQRRRQWGKRGLIDTITRLWTELLPKFRQSISDKV